MAKKKSEQDDFKKFLDSKGKDGVSPLKNKKIPILTLDERWHELFPEYDKPLHIKNLEIEVNNLMKSQGKQITDIKEMKKIKAHLMREIVQNMNPDNDAAGRLKVKKQEKSQQLILELNEKIKSSEEELMDIPYKIREANEALLLASMSVCYERLKKNNDQIEDISKWVAQIREELKQKILLKQDMELKNTAIYSYMHDILGAEVIELFDDKHKE